jgi:hypothetical protein
MQRMRKWCSIMMWLLLQVKLALALMLCGGVQRTDEGGTKVNKADYGSTS